MCASTLIGASDAFLKRGHRLLTDGDVHLRLDELVGDTVEPDDVLLALRLVLQIRDALHGLVHAFEVLVALLDHLLRRQVRTLLNRDVALGGGARNVRRRAGASLGGESAGHEACRENQLCFSRHDAKSFPLYPTTGILTIFYT